MKIFRAVPSRWSYVCDDKMELIDRLLVKRERMEDGFYRRMFDEDFSILLRLTGGRTGNLFEVVSNNDELVQRLLGNDETIRALVEEITNSLIWSGKTYCFLYDDTVTEKNRVVSFSSSGVMSLFGIHIQWVPKWRERHGGRGAKENPREVRILDAAKVMRFVMPTSIKRLLSAQNRTLATLDKHKFREEQFLPAATFKNPKPVNHFAFSVWRDIQDRALYCSTSNTGWNGRDYSSTKCSDFFRCHRLIRFRRNQLLLRDGILSQLSSELSRVGKGYNAEFSVEISATKNLASIAHLNKLEQRLVDENVEFKEILDYCYGS